MDVVRATKFIIDITHLRTSPRTDQMCEPQALERVSLAPRTKRGGISLPSDVGRHEADCDVAELV